MRVTEIKVSAGEEMPDPHDPNEYHPRKLSSFVTKTIVFETGDNPEIITQLQEEVEALARESLERRLNPPEPTVPQAEAEAEQQYEDLKRGTSDALDGKTHIVGDKPISDSQVAGIKLIAREMGLKKGEFNAIVAERFPATTNIEGFDWEKGLGWEQGGLLTNHLQQLQKGAKK